MFAALRSRDMKASESVSVSSVFVALLRLSIPNMEDLKKRILKMVSNCNKPKVRASELWRWREAPPGGVF